MAEFKLKPLSPFHIGQQKALRGGLDLYLEGGILFLLHQEKMIRRFENHPGAWKAVHDYIDHTLAQQAHAGDGEEHFDRDRGGRGDRGDRGERRDRGDRGGRDDRGRGRSAPAPRGPALGDILKRFQVKPGEIAVAAYRWPDKAVPETILPFLRLGAGKAVVPGSSIKGAIRTALLNALARDGEGKYNEVFKAQFAELNQGRAWRAGSLLVSRRLEEALFGGHDQMHRITVRDCEVSFKALGLVETLVQNAVDVPTEEQAAPLEAAEVAIGRGGFEGGREPGRDGGRRPRRERDPSAQVFLTRGRGYTENPAYADSVVYEAIVSDAEMRVQMTVDASPELGRSAATEPFLQLLQKPEALMTALQAYANRQIELELEFLRRHRSFGRLASFYEQLQRQATDLPPNSAMIRLGEGKGWLGIGGAIFDPFLVSQGIGEIPPMAQALSEKGYSEFPKTRVLATRRKEQDVPFGWARLAL